MSAPSDAYPICPKGRDANDQDLTHITCTCDGCGWHGHVGQLLGVDDEDTLWCPQCGTTSWTYD